MPEACKFQDISRDRSDSFVDVFRHILYMVRVTVTPCMDGTTRAFNKIIAGVLEVSRHLQIVNFLHGFMRMCNIVLE